MSEKGYSSLLRKVVSLQREKRLIPEGSRVLVAFSGGPDSVALTLALLMLKEFLKLSDVALVHVNHGIRETSIRDEEFSIEFAKRKKLRIYVERLQVKEISKERGENLEAVAREERYKVLRRIKSTEGFDLIATAHHLNDLVETILLWMVRGCGLEGLLGFEERQDDVVRPLYRVKREEILEFLTQLKEDWVLDESNLDLSIARNRIRYMVIPELKKINPSLEESFLRMRELLKTDQDFIDQNLQEVKKKVLKEGSIDRRAFLKLHPALQKRLIMELYGLKDSRRVQQTINRIKKGSI
ncbi:tRNA lysidine(34) synthetase TilS [Thermocrinis minervae]|uniref:tRNA(Ile)-lysidine synthase n=1 Tax=Thermocrinis minervae TaxID=381751 RepID=A0A1M6TB14_9AQUI|nr:tRNA lysidine(34) synthetase TilS [Thermocrinis minervae]SHK53948.1 tRNA(Ile)-lysidine synthase [Thermocrinis minervae]